MTWREAAIVSAYTGILIGKFADMHAYIEEILGRPVFTHELASKAMQEQIKEAARADFLDLEVVS